jgi:hypothetical protein
MKKNNKTTIELIILLIIILTIYLGVAYQMRDKGEIWCKMSFGDYLSAEYCNPSADGLGGKCWTTTAKFCSRGLFNNSGYPRNHMTGLTIAT